MSEPIIARRHNFQRVYDLAERVLPGWDDSRMPAMEETRRALVLKTVKSLGLAKASWIADYFRTEPAAFGAALRAALGWAPGPAPGTMPGTAPDLQEAAQ